MNVRARCVRQFRDLETGDMRVVGEEFETTDKRLASINAAGYGTLAEMVGEPEKVPEKPKRAPRTRKAAPKRTDKE